MAITINGTIAASRVNASTAPTIQVDSVATGEGVVLLFCLPSSETVSSVAISGETNATQIGSVHTPGGVFGTDNGFAYIFPNIAGSSGNKTITISKSSTGDCNMRAFRISGHDTASPVGNVATGGPTDSANGSVNLTTTGDGSLIIAEAKCVAAISAGANYTGVTLTPTGVYEWEHLWQYDVDAGTAGVKAVNISNTAEVWAIWAAEIKAATASGPSIAALSAYYRMMRDA